VEDKKPNCRYRVGRRRQYRLHPKASVWLPVTKRKWFQRVTTVPHTLWWRCYIERCN